MNMVILKLHIFNGGGSRIFIYVCFLFYKHVLMVLMAQIVHCPVVTVLVVKYVTI